MDPPSRQPAPDTPPSAHPAPSLHRRAWDLIPWVAAGSATAAEGETVHAHAAGCAECREELAFHRALKAGIRDGTAEVDVPLHDPGPALQRLMQRIDQAENAPAGATASAPQSRRPRRPRPAWAANGSNWLVAVVLVQGVALATLLGMLLERPRLAEYRTLSQADSRPLPARIRMVPAPGMTVGELQALLARLELQLVETSADGALLGLAPRAGGQVGTSQALSELRADRKVLLAEPIHDAGVSRP